MPILLVRHELSEANDKNSAAFGQSHARLLPAGLERIPAIRLCLESVHGVTISGTEVAASEMYRSEQTAREVGFSIVRNYALLNEVDVPKTPELRAQLDAHIIVPEALAAAEAVLAHPPEETIWFTHGYLMAALCRVTGVDSSEQRFIPKFGEVRELPL